MQKTQVQSTDTSPFDPEAPPKWIASHWFNCEQPVSLEALSGRVIALVFFQTHCNGSRQHALPQAQRLFEVFDQSQLAVVGLNAPFENKASQTPSSVEAFVKANRLGFPIGIDALEESGLPHTMGAYEVQGTPAVLMFDRDGRLRRHYLGGVDDMRLSAEITAFILETRGAPRDASVQTENVLGEALTEPERHHAKQGRDSSGQNARMPGHFLLVN
ncbi:MAG: TlpA disulfide reductase family protein [Pseudomonadota bacterium]